MSTPGAAKKVRRGNTYGPEDVRAQGYVQKTDKEATEAIVKAAARISDNVELIINRMSDLKPAINAPANRNYKKIKLSANALKIW